MPPPDTNELSIRNSSVAQYGDTSPLSPEIWDRIPQDIKELLFYTHEKPPFGLGKIGLSISLGGVNNLRTVHDPSTIYFPLLVAIPPNISLLPPPEKSPAYYALLPWHKYLYLIWLQNIDTPPPYEGYHLLFLYGLERSTHTTFGADYRTLRSKHPLLQMWRSKKHTKGE